MKYSYEYRFSVYGGLTVVVWSATNIREARDKLVNSLGLSRRLAGMLSYTKKKVYYKKGVLQSVNL